jgi:hypothetical protein
MPPASGVVPVDYVLEAGSDEGASNLGVVRAGGTRALTFPNIPVGRYHVRIRNLHASGPGEATFDQVVVVGQACEAAPDIAVTAAARVVGNNVTLTWNVTPGVAPAGFVIEAGSAPGLANLALMTVHGDARALTVAAPPGRYHVRMRARDNLCGAGATSNELTIEVR